jgi:hypothetical protein
VSKKDKRESKIRENPSNVALKDFEHLIKRYGYIKGGGNHPLAIIGRRVFPYKRTNPVPFPYVERILEIIDGIKQVKRRSN